MSDYDVCPAMRNGIDTYFDLVPTQRSIESAEAAELREDIRQHISNDRDEVLCRGCHAYFEELKALKHGGGSDQREKKAVIGRRKHVRSFGPSRRKGARINVRPKNRRYVA